MFLHHSNLLSVFTSYLAEALYRPTPVEVTPKTVEGVPKPIGGAPKPIEVAPKPVEIDLTSLENALTSLEYLFKFIVKSRLRYTRYFSSLPSLPYLYMYPPLPSSSPSSSSSSYSSALLFPILLLLLLILFPILLLILLSYYHSTMLLFLSDSRSIISFNTPSLPPSPLFVSSSSISLTHCITPHLLLHLSILSSYILFFPSYCIVVRAILIKR